MKGKIMFFSEQFENLSKQLEAINKRLDAMTLAQRAANDAFSDIIAEQKDATPFKLDDVKTQEGISNILGFDPFNKKKRDDE